MQRNLIRILCLATLATVVAVSPALAQGKGDSTPAGMGVPARTTGGPDTFGYTFFDQAELECNANFTDISATGNVVTYTASGGFPAEDDGGAMIALGAPFNFYGTMVNSVVISSNGYIGMGAASLAAESGGDFSNDCPIPAVPDNPPAVNSRIMPYHDDLAGDGTMGTTYYQFFATCPRAGESGGVEACTIFQWSNWGFFGGATGFDLEAILYHTSYEIAFEISDPGGVADGSSATIGIQDGTATDALQYQCNTAGSVAGALTVCNFHPAFPPGSLAAAVLPIPTISPVGMVVLVLLLALGGVMLMMRRRRTA